MTLSLDPTPPPPPPSGTVPPPPPGLAAAAPAALPSLPSSPARSSQVPASPSPVPSAPVFAPLPTSPSTPEMPTLAPVSAVPTAPTALPVVPAAPAMPSFAPLPPAPAMPPLAPVPPVAAQPSLSAMPVAQPSLGQPSAPPAAAPAAPAPPRAVVALDLGDFGSSPASPSSSAAAAVSSSAHPTPAGYAVDARVEENARQLAKGQVATDVKLGATLGGRILVLVGAALVVLANLWAIAVIIGVDAAFTLEALAGAAIATVAGVVLRIVGWTWWTFVAARNARRVAKKPTVSPAFGPVVYGLIVVFAVTGWAIHWGFFVLSSLTYLFGYVAVNKQFSRSGAVIGGGSEGFQTLNRILGLQVLATVVCNILARVSGGSTVVAVLTIVSWCALAAWETVVAQRAFRQFDAACRQPLQPVSFSGDVDLATFLARNNISRTAESYHQS